MLEQLDAFKLHHKSDPPSSKKAAGQVRKFKMGHEEKIRRLLHRYPRATSKELEGLSVGTPYHLSHTQIDRRIKAMEGVERDLTVVRDGCHPIYLK